MRIAVCYNLAPQTPQRGERRDLISEEGAAHEAEAVAQALAGLGHTVEVVALGEELAPFLESLTLFNPKVCFNLCEAFWGESHLEANVAGLYPMLSLPFTGNTLTALSLTQDKAHTKALLAREGIPTPPWLVVPLGTESSPNHKLTYPLFVKPRREDASLGIDASNVVRTFHELKEKVEYIHATYRDDALVEEYIEGRELNVALFGTSPVKVLPISEITFDRALDSPIVTYAGKWDEHSPEYTGTVPLCPAVLTETEERHIRGISLRIYTLLGLRDYARVDVRLRNGIPWVLEVNANPDISPEAGYARSARVEGIPYEELIESILFFAAERKW